MSINTLKTTIRKTMKDKGLGIGFVAKKIGISEKTFGDWIGKNTTMDVFDLVKICEAVDYNFFKHIDLNITEKEKPPKTKKARVLVTLEVGDGELEKDILDKILDKSTVKKLLG